MVRTNILRALSPMLYNPILRAQPALCSDGTQVLDFMQSKMPLPLSLRCWRIRFKDRLTLLQAVPSGCETCFRKLACKSDDRS